MGNSEENRLGGLRFDRDVEYANEAKGILIKSMIFD